MQIIQKKQSGFSLPEILIATAIAGLVAIGGMQLMKSTQDSKKQTDLAHNNLSIQKMIESELFSPKGCEGLTGLKVGQSFSLNAGKQSLGAGSSVGNAKIKDLKFEEFISTDSNDLVGIAKMALTVDLGKRESRVEIPVPVNLGDDSSIISCDLFNKSAYQDVYDNLCGSSFGSHSAGKNCAEVLAHIQDLTKRSICEDIYGVPENVKYANGQCDLHLVHANKKCPTGKYLKGFDAQGKIICGSNAVACTNWSAWAPSESNTCSNATLTQTRSCTSPGNTDTESRVVNGTRTGSSCCTNWSEWSPGTGETCTNKNLTQTRNCLSGSGSESRTVQGTKSCSGTWQLFNETGIQDTRSVCSMGTCTGLAGQPCSPIGAGRNCIKSRPSACCDNPRTKVCNASIDMYICRN